MKVTEVREEINEIIDQLSDEALQELLTYLQQAEDGATNNVQLTKNLRKILTEDQELLKKLAKTK